MKPATPISSPQLKAHHESNAPRAHSSSPLTDYNFQPTAEARTGSTVRGLEKKLRAFRILSRDFLGAEMNRSYTAELLFFALVTGVSAWPIASMIVAVTRMVRNY
jgi:hypothetical protein